MASFFYILTHKTIVKYSWLHPDRVCPLCSTKLAWDFRKEGEKNGKDI